MEDPEFQWAYEFKCRDRKKVSDRVTELSTEWQQNLKEIMSGSSVSILLDGWTNSINEQHHLCFVLGKPLDMIYWSSVVVVDKSASEIFQEIEKVVLEIRLAKWPCSLCSVYSAVRWTSKFECLQTAISRNVGDDKERLLFSH